MTVKEADDSVFDFQLPRGEALSEETLVRCPACGAWSPLSEWNESEVGTGTSDWSAVQCPACQDMNDYVYGATCLACKNPTSGTHSTGEDTER